MATSAPPTRYAPGTLVRARGREWIVLSGSTADVLRLRPLSGSEEDGAVLHTGIEPNVTHATFPPPTPDPEASQEAALLLRDALLLSLRRGAGPFRSFGNVNIEPRAYQLVPLLMALRQDPIRLLIADDVGIGKTIEAGLIARELYDRNEVAQFSVLCPPHLVDQWVRELSDRFNIHATAVTATSAARLERGLPVGTSIFSVHSFTVVSLDYIKSARRRDDFVRACPGLVIIDEAHTCTNPGAGRHLRFELLQALAKDPDRHMILLTATPHSGDEDAFYNLLGLLDPEFTGMRTLPDAAREALRDKLARHFVQRRRPDIDEWMDSRIFPKREVTEVKYHLSGDWQRFFDAVLDYCAELVAAEEGDARRQRLTFWGTLALMRCVSSSPAAAARALRTRMALTADEDDTLADRVFDGAADDLPEDDVELGADTGDPHLAALVSQAERLAGAAGDPKLSRLLDHVEQLLADGFSPVIFCRYIATAHYVAKHLTERCPRATVLAVTGELTPEERVTRVDELAIDEPHVLVATDCLSEGINLQESFDAVVHYDLSWNPTRHEQREGRVDRYGQPRPVVRATLMYGDNNPVDGAVLQVILRKAEKIRQELGVSVPLPDDDHSLTQALMQAVMLRRRDRAQRDLFDFETTPEAHALDDVWVNLADRIKRNRTVFAQRRIKPEDVLPELHRMQRALGHQDDVARFVRRAMARLGAAPSPASRGTERAPTGSLPEALRERLESDGIKGTVRLIFQQPAPSGARFVHRSHPIVTALADDLLERALDDDAQAGLERLGRAGAWRTAAVTKQTTVLLLRLRHQLTTVRGGRSSVMLVEEALGVALVGRHDPAVITGDEAVALLAAPFAADLRDDVRRRTIGEALDALGSLTATLESIAQRQAESLLEDHRRVRQAARATGSYEVRSLTPVDVIGAYVLLPAAAP